MMQKWETLTAASVLQEDSSILHKLCSKDYRTKAQSVTAQEFHSSNLDASQPVFDQCTPIEQPPTFNSGLELKTQSAASKRN
jgi:hypothetical protein